MAGFDAKTTSEEEVMEATGSKIDILVNSTGNMVLKVYMVDEQGIEMQLSANHIAQCAEHARNLKNAEKLWKLSEKLVGEFDY
ncbi:hypothetical protein F5Y06DRAFT_297546 [Hypoxylon sp. FL0890]|nr:hypothetical protein F5Y06DRAFT_297546 [Hypoxylon sp. FL0890]